METLLETRDLDTAYPLTAAHVDRYRRDGFVKLKDVLSLEALALHGRRISARVKELNTLHLPMAERTTYQRAFLQVMNLWERCEEVRELVFCRRLARIAARLMGVRGPGSARVTTMSTDLDRKIIRSDSEPMSAPVDARLLYRDSADPGVPDAQGLYDPRLD